MYVAENLKNTEFYFLVDSDKHRMLPPLRHYFKTIHHNIHIVGRHYYYLIFFQMGIFRHRG